MAYIGKNPTTGSFTYADDISTSSTNTYNILVGGVAFSPESANHCIVSLNGVIQKANTSFSISGSQITFLPSSGTLSSSDSIDFILILGSVNDVGVATTVSDSAITNAKTNFVSTSSAAGLQIKGDGTTDGTLQLNCSQNTHGIKLKSPAHSASASYTLTFPTTDGSADEFLKTDGSGVLSWASAGGTNTPSFRAYMGATQNVADVTNTVIAYNTEAFDTDSAYNTSTFRFTVPSGKAGKYFFSAFAYFNDPNVALYSVDIQIRKNGTNIAAGNLGVTSSSFYNGIFGTNTIMDLSVGDYVDVNALGNTNDSGDFQLFTTSPYQFSGFQGFKLL